MRTPGIRFKAVQRGFTLVELMIAMVIGLVVMGAVYAAYLASASSTRSSRAVAQMTEDATVAINILRGYLSEGGYSRPVAPAATGTGLARAAGTAQDKWLLGCERGFADMSQPIATLGCNPAGTAGRPAVAVAFEATPQNSVTTVKSGTTYPTDCLGAALDTVVPGTYPYTLSYSRFYLGNDNMLYCLGSGSTSAQPLVENIYDMQITYGVGGATGADATRVVAYKDADGVTSLGPWSRVLSVRICLIVRSEDTVAEAPEKYQGCDPFVDSDHWPDAPDKHLYRAFVSTIVLHNRMGVPP